MNTVNPRDFDRIARAIEAISAAPPTGVRLEDLARRAGLSMFHFQRMTTPRGLCGLGFVEGGGEGDAARRRALADLGGQWKLARLSDDPGTTAPVAAAVVGASGERVHLLLKGTNLQIKVWEALLRIPLGETRSYGDIAQAVGKEKRAARAIGNAVGANAISWLIPCHRVIRSSGVLDHYRWGQARKRAMLAWEQLRISA